MTFRVVLSILALISFSCSVLQEEEKFEKPVLIDIFKGASKLQEEIAKLSSGKGIVPNGLSVPSNIEVVRRDHKTWYEFFLFDVNTSLIILSYDPVYFIKVESRDFNFTLNSEFEQIKVNKSGDTKDINHLPSLKHVGDKELEIYFTPKEFNFSTSGENQYRIKQKNGTQKPREDLWRFYEAANNVWFYSPTFSDSKLHEDFADHAYDQGKKRMIWTNSASSTLNNPTNYNTTSKIMNFSWMIGTDLSLTENLLDGEDIRFETPSDLTKPFAAFFSVPIGNPRDTDTLPNLEKSDGIVVVIRGHNLERFIDFFKREGFDFNETPTKGIRLLVTDQKPNLYLNWETTRNVDVYIDSNVNANTAVAGTTMVANVNGSSYTHTLSAATRGYYFLAEIREAGSSNVIATTSEFLLKTDELKVTEVMWSGTLPIAVNGDPQTKNNLDEFIEFKNISGSAMTLNNVKVMRGGTTTPIFSSGSITDTLGINGYYLLINNDTDNMGGTDHDQMLFNAANLPLAATLHSEKAGSLGHATFGLSSSGSVELRHSDDRIIDIFTYTSSNGANEFYERKSAVLKNDGTIGDSTYDLGNAGISHFAGKTFCTPGFAISTEY